MKLVIHPPIDDDRLHQVRDVAVGMTVVNVAEAEVALSEIVDADAFFGKITPELLCASEKLKWVQSPTASLEHFLFPELIEHPCLVTNMRGIFNDVIADHVFAYVLCFARNLHVYLRQQQAEHWESVGGEDARLSFTTGPGHVNDMDRAHAHLSDCTLGIVGVGGIGMEVARRGISFGMRVIGVDPGEREPVDGMESIWPVEQLPELLGQSDFVVVAAPHTPQTERLFRRQQFQQMKASAYLINIGRGAIVVLDDLVAAIEARELAGAALDVFEVEPLPPRHPLWQMPNVIITPHIAACSPRIAARHLTVLLDNVGRFARGDELTNVANKRLWF